MVKGQGQTAGDWKMSAQFIDPFTWKMPNLLQWTPREEITPTNFHVTLSKDKVKLLVLENNVSSISFAGKYLNLVQWMPLASRMPLLIFRSNVNIKLLVLAQMLSVQYFKTPLLENHQTRNNGCPLVEDVPYLFSGYKVKGQNQNVGLNPKCCLQSLLFCLQTKQIRLYLESNLFNHEFDNSMHICSIWILHQGHLCFSNISCLQLDQV